MKHLLRKIYRLEVPLYYAIAIVIVVVLAMSSNQAKAAFKSSNELYTECTAPEGHKQSFCVGYVMGAIDMMSGATACFPRSFTTGQAIDMLVKLLREEPQLRDAAADLLIHELFSKLYPCQRGNTPNRAPL